MINEEYDPEGPELDDVFEMPVPCERCNTWYELNDSNFYVAEYCDCQEIVGGCSHELCEACYLLVKSRR